MKLKYQLILLQKKKKEIWGGIVAQSVKQLLVIPVFILGCWFK